MQHDELVHILERRLEGPEYQTFCGLVVNLFAPAMLTCRPRTWTGRGRDSMAGVTAAISSRERGKGRVAEPPPLDRGS